MYLRPPRTREKYLCSCRRQHAVPGTGRRGASRSVGATRPLRRSPPQAVAARLQPRRSRAPPDNPPWTVTSRQALLAASQPPHIKRRAAGARRASGGARCARARAVPLGVGPPLRGAEAATRREAHAAGVPLGTRRAQSPLGHNCIFLLHPPPRPIRCQRGPPLAAPHALCPSGGYRQLSSSLPLLFVPSPLTRLLCALTDKAKGCLAPWTHLSRTRPVRAAAAPRGWRPSPPA